MQQLVEGLPPGSYLTIVHGTTESPEEALAAQEAYNETPGVLAYVPRTREQIRELFVGLELVDPGPHPAPITPGAGLGGVARIP